MAINDSKWTDVTLLELTRFGFKVMVAGFLVLLALAIPATTVTLVVLANK